MSNRFVGRVHDDLEKRKEELDKRLLTARPAFAISCSDGILVFTTKKSPNLLKIKRILDRVVFAGVGDANDFNKKIYERIALLAKLSAYIERSPGDLRIIGQLISDIAAFISEEYRSLYSYDYLRCEVIIAILGFEQSQDELYAVDFKGEVSHSKTEIIIPTIRRDYFSLSIFKAQTMKDALKMAVTSLNQDESGLIEAAILDRERVREKLFEKAYQKLTSQEVNEWLS